MIIIAVLVGINQFGATTGKGGVAWAQVIETAEMIPALTAEMTAEIIFSENKKLVTKSDLYIAGDYGTRVDIYMNGELWMIKYRLPNKKVAYVITPQKKQYMRIDLSDAEGGVGHDRDDPRQWLKKILSGDYVELGPANINGVDVEGIESNNPEVTGSESMTMRLWIDVETNLPVRIEIEGKGIESGKMVPQKFVVDDFEWNAELDPSIFEPDIPDDYELIEPQKPPKTQ